jgi:hypothetical protein
MESRVRRVKPDDMEKEQIEEDQHHVDGLARARTVQYSRMKQE